jgi:type IX secretion system PorP/SprF family membrane protein
MALMATAVCARGQDPNFSQFFSSPLNINPALTGNINGNWRVISNFRDQWIGPASPYATATISFDKKLFQNNMVGAEEKNIFAMGAMFMYDHAFSGIVKSNYTSLNMSYSVRLSGEPVTNRITAGFGAIYGDRNIDFSRLNFERQFTGYGFNTALPTGEAAKAYFSGSAGVTYSVATDIANFDIGVAGFHLNKPKQTFLEDPQQELDSRYVFHANFERLMSDRVVLNTNAVYQRQSSARYYSAGAGLGYYLTNDTRNIMLTGGLWYWSENAIIPYIGLTYEDFQFGFTYDYTISKLRQAPRAPHTWELSLILRGDKSKNRSGVIPCPWK